MYYGEYEGEDNMAHGDDVYSKSVRAGKRTYFFDVKATKGNDYFITITESRRRTDDGGNFSYEKHKLFLYKEDFAKFTEGFEDVVNFIQTHNTKSEFTRFQEKPAAKVEIDENPQPELKEDSIANSFSNVNFDEL